MTNGFSFRFQLCLFSLLLIIFLSTQPSQASKSQSLAMSEMTNNDDETLEEQRRSYDLKKLRHFLLTSDAAQRAARREQQEMIKRQLIREYLQSMDDPNPTRVEEMKKRFKTYCNSYEDLMNSNWAACG